MNKMDSAVPGEQNVSYRQIGKPRTRIDSPGKVFGKTPYAGDYVMPNMLHAKVLRSKLPSARMTRLDVSKARDLPGVACVLTYKDLKIGTVATDIPAQTGRSSSTKSSAIRANRSRLWPPSPWRSPSMRSA